MSITASVLGSLASGVMGSLFGGAGASPAISDSQKADVQFQGVKSSLQGANAPAAGVSTAPASVSGTQKPAFDARTALNDAVGVIGDSITKGASTALSGSIARKFEAALGNSEIDMAKRKGSAGRAALDTAFPEANVWDKMGAAGPAFGAAGMGSSSQSATQMQEDTQRHQMAITKEQLDSQNKIAGLNGAINYVNTHDQMKQQQAVVDAQVKNINAQTLNTIAQTDRSRELTPHEKRLIIEQGTAASAPGHLGNIYTTGKTVADEAKSWFTTPAGPGDMTINQALDAAKGWFKDKVDDFNASGGILGSQARKETRRK